MKHYLKRLFVAVLAMTLLLAVLPAGHVTAASAQTAPAVAAGDILEFGSYPQTRVTDAALLANLNAQPLSADDTVTYAGSTYKRVYFTQYTDWDGNLTTDAEQAVQDDNGYFAGTAYWFKVEPIRWLVLSRIANEAIVLAQTILAPGLYNPVWEDTTWANSAMRAWLNGDFYDEAFSAAEQTKIRTSALVNDDNPWTAADGGDNTGDKCYLLSYSEAANPAYGFSANLADFDAARIAQGSDYAKSLGLAVSSNIPYSGNSQWWLRSPGLYQYDAGVVTVQGAVDYNHSNGFAAYTGVRPAMRVEIEPPVPVSSVTLSASSATMIPGETVQLTAAVAPANATNPAVAWASNNESVAMVSASGFVAAKATGQSTITCTAADGSGKQAACLVSVVSAAPTGLNAPAKTDTTVSLVWNAAAEATGYNVYSGETKLNAAPVTATAYTATGLTQNTTYTFTVSAVSSGGESAVSAPLSVTTDTTKPLAPTGLTSPAKTDTTVSLAWNAASTATGYNVYSGATKLNAAPLTATTYTVTGLTQNTAYTFTVKAVNAGGESPASAPLSVTTKVTPPPAPTGLNAPAKTDTTVSLVWNAAAGATGYNVYQGATKMNATPLTATTYTATGLTQNTTYTFTVKAVNAGGESPASAPLSVTTDTTKPPAPTGLTSPSKTDTTISLAWNAAAGATGYNVYSGATKLNAAPLTATTYTATGLTQNTTYIFTVKAVNAGGESPASAPLSVTTKVTPPPAPTGLNAPSKTDTTVSLAWNASAGATGYNVYRGTTKLTASPITTTSYTATGLTQNTSYTFTVKAVNAGGESPASAPLSVTTDTTKPPAPTGLKSPTKTDTTISLAWNAATGATGYYVYLDSTKLNATPLTATAYTAAGLTQNTAYTFTVKAVNAGGESPASAPLSVTTDTTKPPAPTGLTSPAKTDKTVSLAWNAAATATGYNVYRGATKLTASAITTTTYTATGLTQNTAYTFTVKAVNAGGESPASAPLSVTTDTTKPPAPTGLKSPVQTDTTVSLAWNAAAGAAGYYVYRDSIKLNASPLTATAYTVTGLTQATKYSFTVEAVNAGGGSPASPPLQVYTKTATPLPPKAASASYNSIKVSWSAVAGATGYALFRYNSATKKYERIKTTTATSHTDTPLTTGKTYYYKVLAYITVDGINVYSAASATATAKPVPATPTNFKAAPYSSTSIKLTWSPVAGASGYVLYRYNTSTKAYERLKVLPAASLSYIHTSLAKGVTYTYKVRAYRTVDGTNIYGNPSSAVSAKT